MTCYGTIALHREPARNTWDITCQPHVAMRLKRVFQRLSTTARDTYRIVDTPETSRDLVWFLERFPLEGTPDDLAELRLRAEAHDKRHTALSALFTGAREPRAFDLTLPPRDYQRIAADAFLTAGDLLLADDLGIGKTVSALTALSDPRTRPALVVTMAHLPTQWLREVHRFLPGLYAHVLRAGTPYELGAVCKRKHMFDGLHCARCGIPRDDAYHGRGSLFPDVVITNYHKLTGWAGVLAGRVKAVVFDEVQELRHDDSAKHGAAKVIAHAADFRLGLSATPIYNYGSEFHAVLDVLCPGKLGTRPEFLREWCVDDQRIKDPRAFGMYLRDEGLMLRRTRADVSRELPPISRIEIPVETDKHTLERIEGEAGALARIILEQGERTRGARMQASEELSNLVRQATGIAKAPYVAAFVRMLVESGQKVVLFGWHRSVYDIWNEKLKDLAPVMYTGSESPTQKEASKKAFVEGDAKVLIMSLRAGAGLDGLQAVCSTVVFGELDWSPGVIDQNVGRVGRDGQPLPVFAYFLVSDGGADPIMADVLGLKRAQAEAVRDPTAELVARGQVDGGHVRRLAEKYLRGGVATAVDGAAT